MNQKKNYGNSKAFYSNGSNMQNTRFFYSDAAAQGYMSIVNKDVGDPIQYLTKLKKQIEDLSFLIKELISIHISNK